MTIEQAISQMEYNRHILGLPYQGDTWRPNANTIACDLALEALREKQERDKGCEYCQNKNGQNTDIWRGNRLSVGYGIYREIHYCPMCGKRLEVEHGN